MMSDDLSKAIMTELTNYSEKISKDLDTLASETAKEAAAELRQTSPKGRTGNYAKSWAAKKTAEGEYTVHNKKYYFLAHLIEKGHVTRNGGRTNGRRHIKPVEEKAVEKFTRGVEKL